MAAAAAAERELEDKLARLKFDSRRAGTWVVVREGPRGPLPAGTSILTKPPASGCRYLYTY